MKNLILLFLLSLSFNAMAACPAVVPTQVEHKILSVTACGTLSTGTTNANAENNRSVIQQAIDNVAAYQNGGVVLIPGGTYRIAITPASGSPDGLDPLGIYLTLKSKVTLRMASNTILAAQPYPSTNVNNLKISYRLISIGLVDNAGVVGGTLQGERKFFEPGNTAGNIIRPRLDPDIGDNGFGVGIQIFNSSNITIHNVRIRDMWGDGILTTHWAGAPNASTNYNKNLVFNKITAINNGRNGISITHGDGTIVSNSTIQNTNGGSPQEGIDIEPDPAPSATFVKNVTLVNNTLTNNGKNEANQSTVTSIQWGGDGIKVGMATPFDQNAFQNIAIISNTTSNNVGLGIYVSEVANVKVLSNTANSNSEGIDISSNTTSTATTTTKNLVIDNTANSNIYNSLAGSGIGIGANEVQNNMFFDNRANGNLNSLNQNGNYWFGSFKNLYCNNTNGTTVEPAASVVCKTYPPYP